MLGFFHCFYNCWCSWGMGDTFVKPHTVHRIQFVLFSVVQEEDIVFVVEKGFLPFLLYPEEKAIKFMWFLRFSFAFFVESVPFMLKNNIPHTDTEREHFYWQLNLSAGQKYFGLVNWVDIWGIYYHLMVFMLFSATSRRSQRCGHWAMSQMGFDFFCFHFLNICWNEMFCLKKPRNIVFNELAWVTSFFCCCNLIFKCCYCISC